MVGDRVGRWTSGRVGLVLRFAVGGVGVVAGWTATDAAASPSR